MSEVKPIVRILCVEDDATRVGVFEEWIKYMKLPYEVRFVWAKSAGAAIGLLSRDRGRVYAGILLDHDLDLQNLTSWDGLYSGKDVVKKIVEVVDKDVPVRIHSTNPKGGPEMKEKLEGAGFVVELMPFGRGHYGHYKDWLTHVCELQE